MKISIDISFTKLWIHAKHFFQLSQRIDGSFIFQIFPLFLQTCTSSQIKIEIFCYGSFLFLSHIADVLTSVCYQAAARNFLRKAHVTYIKEISNL